MGKSTISMAIFNSYSMLNYQRVVVEPSTTLDLSCINSHPPASCGPCWPRRHGRPTARGAARARSQTRQLGGRGHGALPQLRRSGGHLKGKVTRWKTIQKWMFINPHEYYSYFPYVYPLINPLVIIEKSSTYHDTTRLGLETGQKSGQKWGAYHS